jgi:hypothetical protein
MSLPPLKLSIEPVPTPCWNRNLRTALTRDQWDRISRDVRQKAGRCEICGGPDQLQTDEEWTYDDVNHIQRLAGLRCICQTCHLVKHIGRAGGVARTQADRYPTLMEDLAAHFMRVNGVDRDTFKQHRIEALLTHAQRSGFTCWNIDYGDYAELVAATAAMRAKRSKPGH